MKADYTKKSEIMQSGLDKLQRDCQKVIMAHNYEWTDARLAMSYEDALEIEHYMMRYNTDDWKEAHRINDARYKRVQRLRSRISSMIDKPCVFVTLTFTDDILDSTSCDSRRKYVRRYLASQGEQFIANLDYGGKNGREHYHAIIQADKIDCKPWSKKCGNVDVKKVRTQGESETRIAKYMAKLTNHAIKETASSKRIIYSR